MQPDPVTTFDYLVVGSGAGGGPVAANLAAAGFKVLLIEAGSEYDSLNVDVPGFHGQSTEDPNIRWDFWVRHYADDSRQKRDSKYLETYVEPGQTEVETVDGVLYPRCGTVGGCTAHNAMITVYPHNSDWDELRRITGDPSWSGDHMRSYFERLERCTYRNPHASDVSQSRHGFSGWLGTSTADVALALGDPQLLKVIGKAAAETIFELLLQKVGDPLAAIEMFLEKNPGLENLFSTVDGLKATFLDTMARVLDPNDYRVTLEGREGVYTVPLSVYLGVRNGPRERLRRVKQQFPDNLTIWSDTFVTRIVFEGNRAVGVEYSKGKRLYRAAVAPEGGRPAPGPRQTVRAAREVIVAGGAFNTPQLLMLSGIGPKADLDALGIAVLLDRPAVGRYLQDRYEVGVISEMTEDFSILQGLRFRLPAGDEQPDPALEQWLQHKSGIYATNGAVVAIVRRSSPDKSDPDLFIFGLPAAFKGYFPQYADALETAHDEFTWAILKGHTRNKGGTVSLASADPFTRPKVLFRYFDEGTDSEGDDLRSVVEGVKFVRAFTKRLGIARRLLVREDVQPKPDIEDDEQIARWVKDEAWGHHACGTCRIGPKGDTVNAVLDTDFKVQGAEALRVVDASVFPSIPGFFIVTPIYMIAEKASEVILRDAGRALPDVV
jgi:choline dehydrogenase